MPYDYDLKAKQFIGERKVSRGEVRAEIDKLLEAVEKGMADASKRLYANEISIREWTAETQELLTSAHIIAASVGKGGRELMTSADWGKVGAKVRWQNGYLEKFARKIDNGTLSDAQVANRAKMYASSIYTSFANTFQEAQTEFVEGGKNPERCRLVQNSKEGCEECTADAAEGWMSVDDMAPIGSRICGDFCLCDIEFEEDSSEQLDIKVKVTVD